MDQFHTKQADCDALKKAIQLLKQDSESQRAASEQLKSRLQCKSEELAAAQKQAAVTDLTLKNTLAKVRNAWQPLSLMGICL